MPEEKLLCCVACHPLSSMKKNETRVVVDGFDCQFWSHSHLLNAAQITALNFTFVQDNFSL